MMADERNVERSLVFLWRSTAFLWFKICCWLDIHTHLSGGEHCSGEWLQAKYLPHPSRTIPSHPVYPAQLPSKHIWDHSPLPSDALLSEFILVPPLRPIRGNGEITHNEKQRAPNRPVYQASFGRRYDAQCNIYDALSGVVRAEDGVEQRMLRYPVHRLRRGTRGSRRSQRRQVAVGIVLGPRGEEKEGKREKGAEGWGGKAEVGEFGGLEV